jgi:hypothetical protein
MARVFERTGIKIDNVTRPGYRLTCSACPAADHIIASGHSGNLPPDMTTKKFSEKGWTVGNNANHDLCPTCTRAKMMARRKPAEEQNVVPIAPAFAAMAAEAPREMTKEDRRIIFGKLNEVYLDETRGYDTGWNDRRIADDLGVPLAWVRDLRDENFGPEGMSEADRAAIAAAEAFQGKLADLAKQAQHIEDLQEKLAKEIDELKAKFGPVARDVKEVHKAVVRA